MPFHQSQKPVVAAPSETIALRTYATIGKSVSGGCVGFPAHPRIPWNARPLNVIAGLNENRRAISDLLLTRSGLFAWFLTYPRTAFPNVGRYWRYNARP